MEALRQQLTQCASSKQHVELRHRRGSLNDERGYVLAVGRKWVLLQITQDFHLDGYTILPLADIVKCKMRSSFNRLYRYFDLAAKVSIDLRVRLTGIRSILQDVGRNGRLIVLDFCYEDEDYLYLGQVIKAEKDRVVFRSLNTNATWDDDRLYVPYTQISKIRFGNEYCNAFDEFVRHQESQKKVRGENPRRSGEE